jgi:hypothetical protein
MGRWSGRDTVEDCKSISVFWLRKYDYFCGWRSGSMKWTNYSGEDTGSISFQVSAEGDAGYIRFKYVRTDRSSGVREELDYSNRLVATPCNYGKKRWWFICGLIVEGAHCGRRVGKLYLPPGGKYFGCRHCYDLTYESCRESHKFDSVAAGLGLTPRQLRELF